MIKIFNKLNLDYIKMLNKRERIIVLGLITIIVMLTIFFVRYSLALIQNEVKQNAMQTLAQTEKLIQYRMDYAEQISDMIFGNSMVQSYLKRSPEQSGKAEQFVEMDNLNSLIDTAEARQEIKVEMYIPREKFYSLERMRFFPIEEAQEKQWYINLIENNGKLIWEYCREDKTISCIRFVPLSDLWSFARFTLIIPYVKISAVTDCIIHIT